MNTPYEYTDQNGDTLNILPGVDDGNVWVEVGHHETGWVMNVAHDDAPAAALAILEAAGIDGKQSTHAHHAARALMDHESVRQLEAEREAEDAKAREWLRIICPGRFIRDTYTPSELERTTYRAARDFFRESP